MPIKAKDAMLQEVGALKKRKPDQSSLCPDKSDVLRKHGTKHYTSSRVLCEVSGDMGDEWWRKFTNHVSGKRQTKTDR